MAHETRSLGLAFLLSLVLVSGVAVAANLLLPPRKSQTACTTPGDTTCVSQIHPIVTSWLF